MRMRRPGVGWLVGWFRACAAAGRRRGGREEMACVAVYVCVCMAVCLYVIRVRVCMCMCIVEGGHARSWKMKRYLNRADSDCCAGLALFRSCSSCCCCRCRCSRCWS
ncbi:hypothetical protein GQ42DRAFT_46279 [Ramicandelaber brevisporus]|nr:hypothetical protein GQ42DRAFT_46279 [Ramicandelaber brevisporus]